MDEEQFDKLVAAINENTRFLNILAELLATVEKRLATIEGNVHGLYRHSKAPVQPPIPGLGDDDSPMPQPGEIAKSLPRRWSNTVKVYEALWERWEKNGHLWFTLADLADKRFLADVHVRTNGRIGFASMSKIVSVLRRSGALCRGQKGELAVEAPTDEIRERIEAAVALSNAHRPAKEVSA